MASMRSVGVRLRLFVDQYKRDAEEARRANESVGGSGKKAKVDLDQLAGTLTIVGGLMVAAAGATVIATARFDKQMSEVGAVAGATGDELERLRDAAIEAGAATAFSASQAAQAEAELAKAGVITADILGGALSGALDLAAAGSLELATAAEISAKTMNAFGLAGADVGHIADVLAAAANKSATSVEELGIGLQQVALVANQVGLSMEETVALLAAFADRGLAGSDGATSLKTALLRLAAPLGEAKELMDQLGISLYDSNGNMVDAATVAGQLQEGMDDLSAAERNAALNTIFGADAIRAANVLYGLGEDGVREYVAAVDDQGAASDVAAAKLDNLAGDAEALGGSLETLFIRSGEGATGPLRSLTQGATNLINAFGALPGPVQSAGTIIGGLTGVMLLGSAAAIKAHSGFTRMVESLTDMGPAGTRAAGALKAVGTAATIAGIAITGALIAGQVVDSMIDDELNPDLEALAKGLERWSAGSKLGGESARVLGEEFRDLDKALATLAGAPHWVTGLLGQLQSFGAQGIPDIEGMTARVESFDQALAQLVAGGNLSQANELFGMQAAKFEAAGIPLEKLKELLPQYVSALEVAGPAAQEQADLAAEQAEQNIRLGGAFGEAANEAGGLKKAFDVLNGAMLTWRGAERDAEAAVDDLTAALIESNGSLDVHDEKGRAAGAAVDALAQAAIDAAQAKYDETGSVEAANAVYEDYIEQLRRTLINAGHSEDAVDALIKQIAKIPTYKALTIDVVQKFTLQGQPLTPYGGGFFERWGGVVHAAAGHLEAGVVNSPTVIFGERETEQEAFVPKRGNMSRSMAILSEAAGWYNADVVPRGSMASGGMGGGVNVNVTVSAAPGLGGAVLDNLRFETTMVGAGSVQSHMGTRGRYST